jgi:hypothetical protein
MTLLRLACALGAAAELMPYPNPEPAPALQLKVVTLC